VAEEKKLLLKALRRIPLELQIALELHYWEGMTTLEIAEVLEVPRGTVKSRIRRAREALEDALSRLARDPATDSSTRRSLTEWAASIRRKVRKG
jgi:DNA-directed RNA polymerase specialized sigma24 family protein